MDRITACRDYLLNLCRTKTRVAALPGHIVPQSLAEGYAVQERVVSVLLAKSGGKPIGYKIACTSELAQKALGVDGPFFGVLMSATTFASGATLKGDDYLVRCAEAEFGFEMADDVPEGRTYTPVSIKEFIASVIPSIEIVDHRYENWQVVGPPSLLADNAIHGAWVAGEPYTKWQSSTSRRTPPRSSSTASAACRARALRCWAIRSRWSPGWPTPCRRSAASSRRATGSRRA